MLEERISCQMLPYSFFSEYNSITSSIENMNKQKKIIQGLLRSLVNDEIKKYETSIKDYEHLYHQELSTFQEVYSRDIVLLNALTTYVIQQKNKNIEEINTKMSFFRATLLHHRNRSRNVVGIGPGLIIDACNNPLNIQEIAYLSRGTMIF